MSPVEKALEAACLTNAFYGPGNGSDGYDAGLRQEYAQIIAVFLCALPQGATLWTPSNGKYDKGRPFPWMTTEHLAAAVTAAAEGRHE